VEFFCLEAFFWGIFVSKALHHDLERVFPRFTNSKWLLLPSDEVSDVAACSLLN
jgi:hypothetical protein